MINKQNIKTEIETVYEKYVNLVFRNIYSRVRNKHIAEDITSEVFLKIVRNWEKFNSQKASVGTWIFTITRNTLIDYFRKGNNKTSSIDNEDEPEEICNKTQEEYVQIDIDTERVYKAIDKLNELEQQLILLRYISEMSYEEIANETKLNINTVGVKLLRAVTKLQKILDVK